MRGAISIARRLQDPLAELVKIDPKSIGVGQYQHDVDQRQLKQSLWKTVIESCVNRVGVDLNTASWALLRYVAGINERTAQKIVEYRNEHGKFRSRVQLTAVAGLRAEDLRAGGGLPAHPRRRESAGYDGGASGVVPGGGADRASRWSITIAELIGKPELLEKVKKEGFDAWASIRSTTSCEELRKPGPRSAR